VDGVLKSVAGLTARRAAEAALYLTSSEEPHRMPQAVNPETSIAASPIARSGAITAGTGAIGVLGAIQEQAGAVGGFITSIKGVMSTLGIPPGMVLPAVMVVAGGAVIWWRIVQRRSGWA
jgi:hypothetical protein